MITRTSTIVAAVLAAVLLAGYVILDRLVWHNGLPEGLIQANGRIEGDHVTVASKFPGRVVDLAAREGANVVKGSVLIRLDDAQTKAKVDQAARLVDSVMAQVEAAHTALAVLNLEVPLSIEAAAAKVDSARAVIRKAQAIEHEARRDVDRIRALLPEQAVSQQTPSTQKPLWHSPAWAQATPLALLTLKISAVLSTAAPRAPPAASTLALGSRVVPWP